MTVDLLTIYRLNVFITIKIRNSWIKIDNNSAEKFFFQINVFYFVVLKQKKHVFLKKNIRFKTSSHL